MTWTVTVREEGDSVDDMKHYTFDDARALYDFIRDIMHHVIPPIAIYITR